MEPYHVENDFFLLMLNLSQIDDPENIKSIFIEALNETWEDVVFEYTGDASDSNPETVPIATINNEFGAVRIVAGNSSVTDEMRAVLRNAIGMLAVILENNRRARLLSEENKRLEFAIFDRTNDILEINKQLRKEIAEREQIDITLREREERYRRLLELAPDAILINHKDRIGYVNSAALKLFRARRPEDLIGRPVYDIFHPDCHALVRRRVALLRESRKPVPMIDEKVVRLDGTVVDVEVSAAPFTEAGEVLIQVILRDVTERRRAEERFLTVFDASPGGIVLTRTSDGSIIDANPAFFEMFGYPREEVIGRTVLELGMYPDAAIRDKFMASLLERGRIRNVESVFKRKNGERGYLLLSAEVVEIGGEQVALGLLSDITRRKDAEDALRQSESFLDSIIEQSPHAMWISDDKGTLIRLNRACCALLNIRAEEVIGKYNVLHDEIVEEQGFLPLVRQVFEKGETVRFTMDYDTSHLKSVGLENKKTVMIDVTISPVINSAGHVTNAIIQHIDITERKEAEKALRYSEAFLSSVIDQSPHSMWVSDDKGLALKLNRACCKLFNIRSDEVIGKYNLFHDNLVEEQGFMPLVRQVFEKGDTVRFTLDYDTTNLKNVSFENRKFLILEVTISPVVGPSGKVTNAIVQHVDITERKAAENALRENEERFRVLAETLREVMWLGSPDWCEIYYISPAYETVWGHPCEEVYRNPTAWRDSVLESDIHLVKEVVHSPLHPDSVFTYPDFRIRHSDGSIRWISARAFPVVDESGLITRVAGIAEDITDRKRAIAEMAIVNAISRLFLVPESLEEIYQNIPAILAQDLGFPVVILENYDPDSSELIIVGQAGLADMELPQRHPSNETLSSHVVRSGRAKIELDASSRTERYFESLRAHGAKTVICVPLFSGTEVFCTLTVADREIRKDAMQLKVTLQTIANYLAQAIERKRAEQSMRDLLEEKDALLKEVHHRVKNNLQIVASLLSLQEGHAKSADALDILSDTRNRVRSIALLHESLYRSGNLARVKFDVYVDDLCRQLLNSIGPVDGRVKIEKHVEPIGLPLEQTVPCGLIINELVSNALKYAFPDERSGTITVDVGPKEGHRLVISVSDNGVGLPDGMDLGSVSTLGLQLVIVLARQLGGVLEMGKTGDRGVTFTVVFPTPKHLHQPDQRISATLQA